MPASPTVCPRCAAAISPLQTVCTCGHKFDSGNADDALLVQAETLYESYLETRVRSAERALQVARMELSRRPTSASLSTRVYELTREFKTAEAKLQEQRLRTNAVRQNALNTPAAAPPDAFRATQSVKADIALARQQVERLRERVAAADPIAEFEAKASAQAERIMKQRQRDATPCPACGLPLPRDASHCGCGYAARPASRDPKSEFLSSEEIAALRHSR